MTLYGISKEILANRNLAAKIENTDMEALALFKGLGEKVQAGLQAGQAGTATLIFAGMKPAAMQKQAQQVAAMCGTSCRVIGLAHGEILDGYDQTEAQLLEQYLKDAGFTNIQMSINPPGMMGTNGNVEALLEVQFWEEKLVVVGINWTLLRKLATMFRLAPQIMEKVVGVISTPSRFDVLKGLSSNQVDEFENITAGAEEEFRRKLRNHFSIHGGDSTAQLALILQLEEEARKVNEYSKKGDCVTLQELERYLTAS
jgi:hypothetical protein